VFEKEKAQNYPLIDMFEKNWGFAVSRQRLEHAARVLACPVKANPPNWQHGRIIYTVLRVYLRRHLSEHVTLYDIDTAKGFSAIVMSWAMKDASATGQIYSVDVIDPAARTLRNTIADCDGPSTLAEIHAGFPEARSIKFMQSTGVNALSSNGRRVHFAFVDGKHKYEAVRVEGKLLHARQEMGDIIVFDDVQIKGVQQAVDELTGYTKDYITINAQRSYCIATRSM